MAFQDTFSPNNIVSLYGSILDAQRNGGPQGNSYHKLQDAYYAAKAIQESNSENVLLSVGNTTAAFVGDLILREDFNSGVYIVGQDPQTSEIGDIIGDNSSGPGYNIGMKTFGINVHNVRSNSTGPGNNPGGNINIQGEDSIIGDIFSNGSNGGAGGIINIVGPGFIVGNVNTLGSGANGGGGAVTINGQVGFINIGDITTQGSGTAPGGDINMYRVQPRVSGSTISSIGGATGGCGTLIMNDCQDPLGVGFDTTLTNRANGGLSVGGMIAFGTKMHTNHITSSGTAPVGNISFNESIITDSFIASNAGTGTNPFSNFDFKNITFSNPSLSPVDVISITGSGANVNLGTLFSMKGCNIFNPNANVNILNSATNGSMINATLINNSVEGIVQMEWGNNVTAPSSPTLIGNTFVGGFNMVSTGVNPAPPFNNTSTIALNKIPVTNAMSPYTVIGTEDLLLVDTTGGPVTINLLKANNANYIKPIIIEDAKGNFGLNACTVHPFAGDNIQNITSPSLTASDIIISGPTNVRGSYKWMTNGVGTNLLLSRLTYPTAAPVINDQFTVITLAGLTVPASSTRFVSFGVTNLFTAGNETLILSMLPRNGTFKELIVLLGNTNQPGDGSLDFNVRINQANVMTPLSIPASSGGNIAYSMDYTTGNGFVDDSQFSIGITNNSASASAEISSITLKYS